jgi:hypothetical protein
MEWRQHRVTLDAKSTTVVVDSESLLAGLTAETRATLEGFIAEYRDFVMRERSWRRRWSRPERGIDVELSFLNEDMKGAVAAWTANGRVCQLAVLLPGCDREAERGLLTRLVPSVPVDLHAVLTQAAERPCVIVVPMAEVDVPVRPVLQTDLLTLPAAFFALAAEADDMLRRFGG